MRGMESTNGTGNRGGTRKVSERKEEQNNQKGRKHQATQRKINHSETSNSDIITQNPDTINNIRRQIYKLTLAWRSITMGQSKGGETLTETNYLHDQSNRLRS